MNRIRVAIGLVLILLCGGVHGSAQQTVATNTSVAVPPLMNFSGVLTDVNGKPLTGTVGVTFLLYKDQQGGSPLWLETQNVQPDNRGHYTVMLGSTSSAGLPSDIFVAGEAHWLGVQAAGQVEQPRVLLVSAPYALKAGDAQTIGGLPPSAFVLAAPPAAATSITSNSASAGAATAPPPTSSDVTTTGGTVNTLPLFATATNIQSSVVTQAGSGATGKIGINTTTPATTLDVNGPATMRGTLTSPTTGIATAAAGFNSQPQDFIASAFNSSTGSAVAQKFQWQAEPAGNDTATPSATMNLLYTSGTGTPAETHLKISNKGLFTFAPGQTFPGTGTITGVTAGTDLTGGGASGNVTLNLNTAALNAVYPQLAANNTFTGTQTINDTTIMTGNNTAGVLQVTNTVMSGLGPAIVGTTDSSAANAIKGIVAATSGTEAGIFGSTSSGTGFGVKGQSPNVGVIGVSGGLSKEGAGSAGLAGVWGDTGGSGPFFFSGVLGTADDNFAGHFVNNPGTNAFTAALVAEDLSNTKGALVFETDGPSIIGCTIDTGGNLSCTSVTAITNAGSGRKVSLHAVQSPENWFEDFGSGTLVNGVTTIALDPTFAQTVNTSIDYHVFLTPNGDCKGLYLSQKSRGSFEVRELGGGQSNVSFDYRIVAKRAGYEKDRLEDVTERYQQSQKQMQMRRESIAQRRAAQSPGAVAAAAIPANKH